MLLRLVDEEKFLNNMDTSIDELFRLVAREIRKYQTLVNALLEYATPAE